MTSPKSVQNIPKFVDNQYINREGKGSEYPDILWMSYVEAPRRKLFVRHRRKKEGQIQNERGGNLIYSNEMREVFCAPVCATPTVTGSAMPDRWGPSVALLEILLQQKSDVVTKTGIGRSFYSFTVTKCHSEPKDFSPRHPE